MPSPQESSARTLVDELYRTQSRRVFATLVRLLGNFDLAEEALHEAFAAAIESWEREGVPKNPRAWLVSTGRFKAIDAIRRRARFDATLGDLALRLDRTSSSDELLNDERVSDDQLRLIFTCCHPALAPETQVALTLREVCGLQTDEIGHAFLVAPSTIAQRIVRGKAKIRDAGISYEVPHRRDLPERLDSVLAVIYLVFSEGYSASSGESVTRGDLSGEAIRLGRLLVELLPDAEVLGLLALMLLQESRRPARMAADGELILLENQDRSLWLREHIEEGQRLVEQALSSSSVGAYTIQAAIAAVHANAARPEETDWPQIVALYETLLQSQPSPIVELNLAVALAMRDGPEAGLQLIQGIISRGDLADYHLLHATQADFHRRLNQTDQAREAYRQALALARQLPERRFLEQRLQSLE